MKQSRRFAVLAATFAVVGLATAPSLAAQPTPEFGTSSPTIYHVGFTEFVPLLSTTHQIFSTAPYGFYSSDAPVHFLAVPHVPSGVLLTRLELQYCDTNPVGNDLTVTLRDCSTDGLSCTILKTFDSNNDSCNVKAVGLSTLNYTVQNSSRVLIVDVTLRSADGSNFLLGVNIGYRLQVSPAPSVATFADVPTTSPQFKFVEALVAAGITAGCGNGDFCPNAPITRGQMAVFLATALGLQFPD
jgi:hypothetical protein